MVYGFKRTCNINDVIRSMFEEKSKATISSCPLENIKSTDPTMFPPCKVIIEQQTKSAWFIANLYKTAVEAYPAIKHATTDFGWKLDKNHEYLLVIWSKDDQIPPQLELTNVEIDTEKVWMK